MSAGGRIVVTVGSCATCGKTELRIKKNGTVWNHGDPTPGVWPPQRCTGSGEQPEPGSVHEIPVEL